MLSPDELHRRGLALMEAGRLEEAGLMFERVGIRVSKNGEISKFLQIFGGLVLGCIKTKFCKKICV